MLNEKEAKKDIDRFYEAIRRIYGGIIELERMYDRYKDIRESILKEYEVIQNINGKYAGVFK